MKKTFDAVAFMRKRREEIDREDEGLTWEEKSEKTRRILLGIPQWRGFVEGLGQGESAAAPAPKQGEAVDERQT